MTVYPVITFAAATETASKANGKPPKAVAAKGAAKAPAKAPAKAAKPAKPVKAAKAAKAAKVAKPAKDKPKGTCTFDPAKLDQFGLRPGSLKAQAAAMYSAKGGATLTEVKEALQSVQFNVITMLRDKGFTVDEKQEDGAGHRKVTRYFLKAKK
jgi:hypothetical protein